MNASPARSSYIVRTRSVFAVFGKQLIRVVGLLDELADEVVLESRERFDEVGLARPLAVEPVLAVHSLEEMDVVPAAATEPL